MEKPLTKEETHQLIAKAQQGDKAALEKLVIANTKLVHMIVRKMNRVSLEQEDLTQVGLIGLTEAIKKFDLSRNLKFSTYAYPTIHGEIRRFTRDKVGTIRVPRPIHEAAARIYIKQLQDHTPEQVCEILELNDVETAKYALHLSRNTVKSLDEKFKMGDDELPMLETIEGDLNTDWFDKVALREALNKLTERERTILNMKYGYDKTQKEIGHVVGVSQMQVSRLERKALVKLKELFLEKELV